MKFLRKVFISPGKYLFISAVETMVGSSGIG
jgi:hypothetical protein